MVSWQEWHYCDCADPTTSGPGVQSLVVDPAKPPRGDNVKRAKLAALARPYPRAVAGTPRSYGFDPQTKRFDLVYSTRAPAGEELGHRLPRSRLTEVFIPRIQYPDGYSVEVTGADLVSKPNARVLRLERRRRDAVTVAVTPR
jgi:endoglycosylceramidase